MLIIMYHEDAGGYVERGYISYKKYNVPYRALHSYTQLY